MNSAGAALCPVLQDCIKLNLAIFLLYLNICLFALSVEKNIKQRLENRVGCAGKRSASPSCLVLCGGHRHFMSYYISFSYFKLAQKLTISAPTLHWAGRGRAALLCTILQMHGRTFFSSADAQLQLICWWRAATVSTAAGESSTLLSPLRQKLWRSCVSDNSGAVQCCIVLHSAACCTADRASQRQVHSGCHTALTLFVEGVRLTYF